jgi:glycosyltransferase involved in cell wall biosynthesis
MKKTKLSIVMPVYNEGKTVLETLHKVYAHQIPNVEKELIIVESNSDDNTRDVVSKFAKGKKDVKLILEDRPRGKGTAVRTGFKNVTGDIVLIQDADSEYDVKDYDKLLKPIMEGKTKFVLGSRHMDHNENYSWAIRKFEDKNYALFMNLGGVFFHGFFNLVYGTKLTDPTTMYKVFDSSLLRQVHFEGKFFELDWEIVCKFLRLGHVPIELPITYHSRSLAEGKKVRVWRDAPKYMGMILKVRFTPRNKL